MSSIQATIRNTKTKGQVNDLRSNGKVPGIVYGGEEPNEKISITTKELKNLINKENFLSNVISINLDGKEQKVLTRNIAFDTVTDEPIHFDLMRIVKGGKIILEIPVKFINHPDSPGLKRGGVLNIVRRSVELKCPAENIPNDITIDLAGTDIGTSLKISSVKLPESVVPTITDRDFVIATVAAPTIIKEPEKPAEGTAEGAEGETPVEGAEVTNASPAVYEVLKENASPAVTWVAAMFPGFKIPEWIVPAETVPVVVPSVVLTPLPATLKFEPILVDWVLAASTVSWTLELWVLTSPPACAAPAVINSITKGKNLCIVFSISYTQCI